MVSHDMDTRITSRVCGTHKLLVYFQHKGSVMQSFANFFVDEPLIKQSRGL